ncbi:hypothetical protein SHIRM173S_10926 [Streptomyces hirsutus]
MLKLVPNELREASLALGIPKWRTILKVVLPTSIGGIVNGVMLAIARITGETAPVLLLVWGIRPSTPTPSTALRRHCRCTSTCSTRRLRGGLRPCLGSGSDAHRVHHDPQPRGSRHRPLEGPEDRSLTRPSATRKKQ